MLPGQLKSSGQFWNWQEVSILSGRCQYCLASFNILSRQFQYCRDDFNTVWKVEICCCVFHYLKLHKRYEFALSYVARDEYALFMRRKRRLLALICREKGLSSFDTFWEIHAFRPENYCIWKAAIRKVWGFCVSDFLSIGRVVWNARLFLGTERKFSNFFRFHSVHWCNWCHKMLIEGRPAQLHHFHSSMEWQNHHHPFIWMKRWKELKGSVKHVMDIKWRRLAISSPKVTVTATRSFHHFVMAANGRKNNSKLKRTLPIEHPCDLYLVCIIFCSIIQCLVIYL